MQLSKHSATSCCFPNIMPPDSTSVRFFRGTTGAFALVDDPSPIGLSRFDFGVSPREVLLDPLRIEGTITKPSRSFGDCESGLSVSTSADGRFWGIELEGPGELRSGCLLGPSSTNVASVSFGESVSSRSSSSSSSLEVTRASLASSIVGVIAAASANSRLKKSSASWFMTRLHQ